MFETLRGTKRLGSVAVTSALVLACVLAACSSDDAAVAPVATCDDAKCNPGNQCLPLNGEIKCRKTCSSNTDPATSCPFGYTCTDTGTGAPPFCIQNKGSSVVQKPSGQWGAKCQANLGISNPGCDIDQGFYCYGISPTDGDAYCTRYECASDDECGAGFWCGQVNNAPNVGTSLRSAVGATQRVCLRRSYCAPCKVDLDCPTVEGTVQHCIPDASGAGVCMSECQQTANCPNEARCTTLEGMESKVCYPRATICVGDGSLCSPCRSDADCGTDGACVKGQYTTEKTCAKKSTSSCKKGTTQGSCATKLSTPPSSEVRCLGGEISQVPEDYCHGIYVIGGSGGDVGCWTAKR